MVEVNGVYNHGRYEQIWLKSMRVMSNIKVFATQDKQMASRSTGRQNTTNYIDLYNTHMDQTLHIWLNNAPRTYIHFSVICKIFTQSWIEYTFTFTFCPTYTHREKKPWYCGHTIRRVHHSVSHSFDESPIGIKVIQAVVIFYKNFIHFIHNHSWWPSHLSNKHRIKMTSFKSFNIVFDTEVSRAV